MPKPAPTDLRRAVALERATLAWNVVGVPVLLASAVGAGSVGLLGFALDSLLEIAASSVVLWELAAPDDSRQRRVLTLVGSAFAVLAAYPAIHSSWVLVAGERAGHSATGVAWTAATAAVMASLSIAKGRVGHRLSHPVVIAEVKVTAVDAALAAAVLVGLVAAWVTGAWWTDPLAALLIAAYAACEARELLA